MQYLLSSLALMIFASGAFAAQPEMMVKTVEIKNAKELDSEPLITPIIGEILSTAESIVTLGEKLYTLVQKGKPTNVTDFAPISVVPKDPVTKEVVNPFELENCSLPTARKFRTTMTTAGIEVVNFEYMIIYSYGCSYNGVGKYIQALSIIPVRVKTSFGWDFNATMKFAGMMNHGKKLDPIVGATIVVKYSMNSWLTAIERNDTMHVTGAGDIKVYSK